MILEDVAVFSLSVLLSGFVIFYAFICGGCWPLLALNSLLSWVGLYFEGGT